MAENLEIRYREYDERTPDSQYRDLLEHIYTNGRTVKPIQGEEAKMVMGAQLRYDMSNGFPAITERDLTNLVPGAIAEHVAFLNGVRTQNGLEEFGCKWWAKWLTPKQCAIFGLPAGDMGPGSYGAAWTDFPTPDTKTIIDDYGNQVRTPGFDQIEHLVRQIKERPFLRTHVLSPWIPEYTLQHSGLSRQVVVAPCHGYVHVMADPATKELSVHHIQRSGDLPVGVPFNIIQYGAFGLMLAKMTGYTFSELVQTFSDVHIYESQYGHVEQLLNREPRRLGALTLTPEVDGIDNIKDFRPNHFELHDYKPHPAMTIPTPV